MGEARKPRRDHTLDNAGPDVDRLGDLEDAHALGTEGPGALLDGFTLACNLPSALALARPALTRSTADLRSGDKILTS
jgi:hypothetical protein